uniref:Uncharacterized protein n=1 Tax=Pipistrellus kuhlii TaxID=59472 RepID=A0A7J7RZW2_PIPKU|nr:hypothetical protein mPipKuh1_010207 [Pipistrellus kuhlii]
MEISTPVLFPALFSAPPSSQHKGFVLGWAAGWRGEAPPATPTATDGGQSFQGTVPPGNWNCHPIRQGPEFLSGEGKGRNGSSHHPVRALKPGSSGGGPEQAQRQLTGSATSAPLSWSIFYIHFSQLPRGRSDCEREAGMTPRALPLPNPLSSPRIPAPPTSSEVLPPKQQLGWGQMEPRP